MTMVEIGNGYAISHDPLNTIISRMPAQRPGKQRKTEPQWTAVYFVYSDKAVLQRALRELGAPVHPYVEELPENLRKYRAKLFNCCANG